MCKLFYWIKLSDRNFIWFWSFIQNHVSGVHSRAWLSPALLHRQSRIHSQESPCTHSLVLLRRQPLIHSQDTGLSTVDELTLREHMSTFVQNGFDFVEDSTSGRLRLSAVPFSKGTTFGVEEVHELVRIHKYISYIQVYLGSSDIDKSDWQIGRIFRNGQFFGGFANTNSNPSSNKSDIFRWESALTPAHKALSMHSTERILGHSSLILPTEAPAKESMSGRVSEACLAPEGGRSEEFRDA